MFKISELYRKNFLGTIKEESFIFSNLLEDSYKECAENLEKFVRIKKNNHIFKLYEFEEIYEIIGQGAYGVVAAVNTTDKEYSYAIKKISNLFEMEVMSIRTLRELRICRLLNHPNIMKFEDIRIAEPKENYKEIYLKLPLMESDLENIIALNENISTDQKKYLIYQLVLGVNYLHKANIIHRDIVL